ncbi:MAG: toll/interleukin-1 receptor domain-containing protein [Prolixibacteraceae bacterium]|nr:toll/interleukin-1 receptor domain-containing protein [Prolixibacteraceae bacterium]
MHDIMISYSSKDKSIADAVCNNLETNGIRVWMASRDIKAGASYPTAILEGIKTCSIIVLVFTSNSNKSEWVPKEIERGVHYGKIIIPFKIEEVSPINSDIELCTCTQHWLDALTPPLEVNIAKLVVTIKKLLDINQEGDSLNLRQKFTALSPLGQFYQLSNRWAQNNYAYYVLESLNEEQKSILRNAPKTIEIEDENVMLFMLEASLHFGGDWVYWGRRINNKETLAKHLVKMLGITYIRPRYRSLYLMQDIEKTYIEPWLETNNLTQDEGLMKLLEKHVYTKIFLNYLFKVSESTDPELAKRAKTVLFEINRYDSKSKGLDVFPNLL